MNELLSFQNAKLIWTSVLEIKSLKKKQGGGLLRLSDNGGCEMEDKSS